MALSRTDRERRRRAFLRCLATGRSVTEAADHAGIGWSTLYLWRQKAAAFRAAWDRAAEAAQDALTDRLQAALIQRAVEGTDEPVFHEGVRVGYRRRYSDTLLLAGLRQLTGAYGSSTPVYTVTAPERPAITVRKFAAEEEAPATPEPEPPAPAPRVIVAPAPSAPPGPADTPALNWAHLGRSE